MTARLLQLPGLVLLLLTALPLAAQDVKPLLQAQAEDGSWPADQANSQALNTALATLALGDRNDTGAERRRGVAWLAKTYRKSRQIGKDLREHSLAILAVADWQLTTGHREHNAFLAHSLKALAATRLTHPRLRIPLGWPSHERALRMVDTSTTVMAILALRSAAACEVMGADLLLDGAANWLPLAWAAANPGFTKLHHASFSAFPLIWTPNASRGTIPDGMATGGEAWGLLACILLDHQAQDLTRSSLTQTVVHEKTLALGPGSTPWDWLPIVLIWPQQFSAVSSAPVRTGHRAQLLRKAGADPFYHFLLRASTTADPTLAVCRDNRYRSAMKAAEPGSRKRGDPISKTGQQMDPALQAQLERIPPDQRRVIEEIIRKRALRLEQQADGAEEQVLELEFEVPQADEP